MRRRWFLIAAAFVLATFWAWRVFQMPMSLASESPQQHFERIVSLAPSFTETLIALNESKHLVGITAHCPPVKDAHAKVVGTFANPSLESILSLRPDLVLLVKHPGTKAIATALSNTRTKVYVHEAESLDDIFAINLELAALFQKPALGQIVNEKMLDSVEKSRAQLNRFVHSTFLIFFGHHPLVAASPSTYPSEILQRLGLINAVEQKNPKWPIWPLEKLLTTPPDFILIAEGKDAWPIYEKIFSDIWAKGKGPTILVPNKAVLMSPTVKMVEDLPVLVECFSSLSMKESYVEN